jgi:hypothetical protein
VDCSFSANNTSATTEAGEGWGGKTVWYSFSPAATGAIYIRATSTARAGWDNTLHLIDSSGTLLASNDDSYGLDAAVTANVVANQTYRVALGSYSSETGQATISLTMSLPDTPTGLSATAGNAVANLTWTSADISSRSLTSFRVTAYNATTNAEVRSQTVSGTPPAQSMTFTGLTNGTSYKFKILATNANGNSPLSNFSNSVTPLGAPSAPTISSITSENTQLTVNFSAPSSNGGAEITNYQYSINGGANWTVRNPVSTTSPLVLTGLTNGTAYPIQIKAVKTL